MKNKRNRGLKHCYLVFDIGTLHKIEKQKSWIDYSKNIHNYTKFATDSVLVIFGQYYE